MMLATDIIIGAIGIDRNRSATLNTVIVAMIALYVFLCVGWNGLCHLYAAIKAVEG